MQHVRPQRQLNLAFSLGLVIVQRTAGTVLGYKSMSDRCRGIRVYYADNRLIAVGWDERKLELSSFQLVAGSLERLRSDAVNT
jgi:hypothetical protein